MNNPADNLRPFKPKDASTEAEASRHRELSAKGGRASGESRRRKVSMREELLSLLSLDDGAVAKGITIAIAREAKNGNVAAYKAILEALGETVQKVEQNCVVSPIEIKMPSEAKLAEVARRRSERNARDERELREGIAR